jgi:hypothetical protein
VSDSWQSNKRILQLLAKHANSGILVDSNLLLMLGVGSLDPNRVSKEKGTREYSPEDFDILSQFLARFKRQFTTPNILTEVCNLSGQLRADIRRFFRQWIRDHVVVHLDEQYIATKDASSHLVFERLGVTDAAIAIMADQGILVLTSDLDLSIMLDTRGLDCILYRRDLASLLTY